MRHLRSLAVGFIGALGTAGLLASSALALTPEEEENLINPVVTNCNTTPEAVEVTPAGSTKPREFKATPINGELLKPGQPQPCQQTVSAAGRAGDDTVTNRQRGFDFYSWLTFLAMNSPADGKTIIGKGAGPRGDAMTMWEDLRNYRPLADVMQNDDAKRAWGTRHVPELCKSLDGPGKIVFHLGEEAFNQPFKTGPLIDQDGNYALFDILMNKPMFDFIDKKTLYNKRGQAAFKEEIQFPTGVSPGKDQNGNPTPGRMGAIMLKVSYRILDPVANKDIIEQFHTSDALIFFPGPPATKTGPTCVEKKLGLVGFHVGHKTRFAPQWVWTSFEHVSNVPDEADVKAGKPLPLKRYNFFKENCKDCAGANATPEKPWHPPASLKFPTSFRSQVVRTKMIPGHTQRDVDQLNQSFRKILQGTVWENYVLLTTQWPSEFDSKTDPTGAPAPTYLANSTLETFSQGKSPLASSSCMACHGNAVGFQRREADATKFDGKPFNQSDFTFILEKAAP